MTCPQIKSFFIIFSFLFLCVSCVADKDYGEEANSLRPKTNQNQNINSRVNSNANIVEDNAIKLKELINLPFEPEEDNSPWREDTLGNDTDSDRVPGPNDRKLTAVLRFSAEDTKALITSIKDKKPPFEIDVDAESWFPAELIAKSETSGDESLKGTGYSAEDFIKPPYSTGTLIHIKETDYFVLVLQTQ